MSEEIKTQETVTETVENNQENTTEKTFTQEQVNGFVKSRVIKERNEFAQLFGMDSYDKEAFNSLASGINSNTEKLSDYEAKMNEYDGKFQTQQKELYQYKHNIKEDSLEKALALAELEVSKDSELDIDKALSKVLEELPSLKTEQESVIPKKIGSETKNETKINPNPYVTDSLTKRYPFLKK